MFSHTPLSVISRLPAPPPTHGRYLKSTFNTTSAFHQNHLTTTVHLKKSQRHRHCQPMEDLQSHTPLLLVFDFPPGDTHTTHSPPLTARRWVRLLSGEPFKTPSTTIISPPPDASDGLRWNSRNPFFSYFLVYFFWCSHSVSFIKCS